MNYFVHAFMYTYYAFRALHIHVPAFVAKCITSLQILQMFLAVYISFYIYFMKTFYYETVGKTCMTTDENLKYSFTIYLTYLVLFVHFFTQAYIKKNHQHGKAGHQQQQQQQTETTSIKKTN